MRGGHWLVHVIPVFAIGVLVGLAGAWAVWFQPELPPSGGGQADQGARVNLVDPRYDRPLDGDYHKTLSGDFDQDGETESIHLIAAVERVSTDARAGYREGFAWDDGQPWQVYVEEASGQRTYVFSRFVQLGDVDVLGVPTGDGGGELGQFLILVREGAGLGLYAIRYHGPGRFDAEVVAEASGSWAYPFLPDEGR